MTARERIQEITERWFLLEPLFFAVYCTHQLVVNANMACPLRTGRGRIEYNPERINTINAGDLNNKLNVEIVRILLGHPYARQPIGGKPIVLHMASDMVISPAYPALSSNMVHPSEAELPEGKNFEWYISRLNEMFVHRDGKNPSEGDTSQEQDKTDDSESQNGGSSAPSDSSDPSNPSESSDPSESRDPGDSSAPSDPSEADYTALWEEDQFVGQQLKELIQSTTQWGSVPGKMVEIIKKAAAGRIDYRNVLRMFRSSILSQQRRLTRMRPSRRFGFEQMGSQYNFTTKLLIAIDTSGSVSSMALSRYLHVITSFFKYGIEEISLLMFDYVVQSEPIVLKSNAKNNLDLKVTGRGGTNFQAPIHYVNEHPDYDGLIIITDGFAPAPKLPLHWRTKILWVIDNEDDKRSNFNSLRKIGRVCMMDF